MARRLARLLRKSLAPRSEARYPSSIVCGVLCAALEAASVANDPLDPDVAEAKTASAATPAVGTYLADLLTAARAEDLFGADAATMRASLLAARGPIRDALATVIAGPQARRAALTYARLIHVGGAAIPDAWAAILVRAAGSPRSAGANGSEGILGPIDAQNAAIAYGALSTGERASIAAILDGAARAAPGDAMPAQALILKALAARRTVIAGPDAAARAQALHEIAHFAAAIQGIDRGDLLRRTSLLDIDETADTEGFDPLSLEDRPGSPADRPITFTGTDNDGLFQRYEMSCGPASIEVLLGERDPVYAFRRRSTPMDKDPAAADDLQTQVLKQYGLTPASRVVPAAIVRLRGAMAALEAKGLLSEAAAAEVSGFLLSAASPMKGPLVDRALAAIRAANDGFPDAATADQIRGYTPPEPGKVYGKIGFDNVTILLNRIIGRNLAVEYTLKSLYDEQGLALDAPDAAARSIAYVRSHLDQIEQNLADGIDIVFGTSNPEHFWSMSNVQGKAPGRQFLVHDTWSGRTGWAREQDLADGSFARAFLGESKTGVFIDLLYLVD